MKKKWMKEFANKSPQSPIEGVIHVFANPCMAGCCANNGGCCVLDAQFLRGNLSEGKEPMQTWVFVGVAHKATVYVYEGKITENHAKQIAVSQARFWGKSC